MRSNPGVGVWGSPLRRSASASQAAAPAPSSYNQNRLQGANQRRAVIAVAGPMQPSLGIGNPMARVSQAAAMPPDRYNVGRLRGRNQRKATPGVARVGDASRMPPEGDGVAAAAPVPKGAPAVHADVEEILAGLRAGLATAADDDAKDAIAEQFATLTPFALLAKRRPLAEDEQAIVDAAARDLLASAQQAAGAATAEAEDYRRGTAEDAAGAADARAELDRRQRAAAAATAAARGAEREAAAAAAQLDRDVVAELDRLALLEEKADEVVAVGQPALLGLAAELNDLAAAEAASLAKAGAAATEVKKAKKAFAALAKAGMAARGGLTPEGAAELDIELYNAELDLAKIVDAAGVTNKEASANKRARQEGAAAAKLLQRDITNARAISSGAARAAAKVQKAAVGVAAKIDRAVAEAQAAEVFADFDAAGAPVPRQLARPKPGSGPPPRRHGVKEEAALEKLAALERNQRALAKMTTREASARAKAALGAAAGPAAKKPRKTGARPSAAETLRVGRKALATSRAKGVPLPLGPSGIVPSRAVVVARADELGVKGVARKSVPTLLAEVAAAASQG
jgi:hypothetical protein